MNELEFVVAALKGPCITQLAVWVDKAPVNGAPALPLAPVEIHPPVILVVAVLVEGYAVARGRGSGQGGAIASGLALALEALLVRG